MDILVEGCSRWSYFARCKAKDRRRFLDVVREDIHIIVVRDAKDSVEDQYIK